MRVLVIDDSRAMLAILGKILGEVGMEVVTANNGRDGLRRQLQHHLRRRPLQL